MIESLICHRKFAGAAALTLCLLCIGCSTVTGPSAGSPGSPSQAKVSVFLKDAPSDSVLAFDLTLTDTALLDSGGKRFPLLGQSRTFELRQLRLASTLAISSAATDPATFSGLEVGLSSPRITLAGANGAVQQLTETTTPSVTLAKTTATVPINFSAATGQAQALMLDFDLQSSLSVDSGGNYLITPVLKSAAVGSTAGDAQLSMTLGKIVSVQATPANSLDVQLSTTSDVLHVKVDAATVFDTAVGQFSSLKAGQMIELEATFQPDGTYLAKFVNLGAPDPTLRFQGLLTDINQSGANPVMEMVVTQ